MYTHRVLAGASVGVAAVFGMTMLASLAVFFQYVPQANALSCVGPSQAAYQTLFSQGGYIFIGTITDVHLDSTSVENRVQTDSYTVKAKVDRAWGKETGMSVSFKNVVTHAVAAPAGESQVFISDWGPTPFVVGTHGAIFVWNKNGILSSEEGSCSFNRHLNTQAGETYFISEMKSWGFGEGSTPSNTPDDWGTAAGTYCPRLSQTLVRGSSGNQVLELQKFLSDYYDIPPATIQTGYFGRITQGYVIQFQKEQGLPSYGIAGSMTRAAIAKVCGSIQTTQSALPGSVQIISPNQDVTWQIGLPYVTRWTFNPNTYIKRGMLYQSVVFEDENGRLFQPPLTQGIVGTPAEERQITVPHYFQEIKPGRYRLVLEIRDNIAPLPCVGCTGYDALLGVATSSSWITLTAPPSNLQPAILSLTQSGNRAGDSVVVRGVSFTGDAKVVVQTMLGSLSAKVSVSAQTVSPEVLSFTIPTLCTPTECATVNPNTTYWIQVETVNGKSNLHQLDVNVR